ncbi:hypothetical protein CH373_15665 [Leptospira perolatii]|uniref:DUF6285 domain-containing protein n=1 Tax=Leptospira perolatii TaxID=2023191 RepID=A0A2M9ZJE6_9LEPT|nr:DUF6285 domain-containing protein [Leptospira perolatii]PJZ68847.1 hypothetical protein CH360_14125 [Leptospira perolatii]PJZ72178.1 hypothetical protein CH373_15665 [Leptospira perolatii]
MQDKPTSTELLEAIQDFLMKEVLPSFRENDLLSYKTLVSWNMLGVVSREIRNGEELLDRELSRLSKILQKELKGVGTLEEKKKLAESWNAELTSKIQREKSTVNDRALWEHVKESVKEKIEVTNPRFTTEA